MLLSQWIRRSDQLVLLLATSIALLANGVFAQTPTSREHCERVDAVGDPLPEGVLARIGSCRFRMAGWIDSLAYSHTGGLLMATSEQEVSVWDARTGKRLLNFDLPSGWIHATAFSADDRAVVCIQGEKLFHCVCRSVDGGRLLCRWELPGDRPAISAALSADGRVLAVARNDGVVGIYRTDAGTETLRLSFSNKDPYAVLSPDARLLAICDASGPVHLYDAGTGNKIRTLKHEGVVFRSIKFSPDGRLLAGFENKDEHTVACIWELATGRQLCLLKGTSWSIWSAAFSPDGALLAANGPDGPIILWNARTGNKLRSLDAGSTRLFVFAPDGTTLAGAGSSEVAQFDMATGRRLAASAEPPAGVLELSFTEGGKRLVGRSGAFRTWDSVTGRQLNCHPELPPPAMWPQVLSPDGRLIAASEADAKIGLWDAASAKKLRTLVGHQDFVQVLKFTPDGRRLISGSWDKTIRIWDVAAGAEIHRLLGHSHHVRRLSLSADGRRLVSACGVPGNDHTVTVWDLQRLGAPNAISLRGGWAHDVVLSPDGRWVAAVAVLGWPPKPENKPIIVWDAATGREWWRLNTGEYINRVTMSADGRTLATGADHGQLHLFELATAKHRRAMRAMRGHVLGIAFSPNGRLLAASSEDAPAYLWVLSPPGDAAGYAMDQLWAALASEDGVKAYSGVRQMIAAADRAVPFVRAHLRAAAPVSSEEFDQLIRELDDKRFAVRDKALAELRKLDMQALAAIHAALSAHPSAEVRQALQRLVDRCGGPVTGGENLRIVRAVEVLEDIGTAEAVGLLTELSSGDATARLTREAKQALDHLSHRPVLH